MITEKELVAAGFALAKNVKEVEGATLLTSTFYDTDYYQVFQKQDTKFVLCLFPESGTYTMRVSKYPAIASHIAYKLGIITKAQFDDMKHNQLRMAGRAIND